MVIKLAKIFFLFFWANIINSDGFVGIQQEKKILYKSLIGLNIFYLQLIIDIYIYCKHATNNVGLERKLIAYSPGLTGLLSLNKVSTYLLIIGII